jgi:hypothetical protein
MGPETARDVVRSMVLGRHDELGRIKPIPVTTRGDYRWAL